MNGVTNGIETDLSLTSETRLLLPESNSVISVPEEISSSEDKIYARSAVVEVNQSCDVDATVSSLSVAELKSLSLEADTDIYTDHSIVPFLSSSGTDDQSDNSAATAVPLTTADTADILATNISVPSSSCPEIHAEVNSDFTVRRLSSFSQEANSLSFLSTDKAAHASSCEPEVKLSAITTAELCELRPEEVRWLYRQRAVRQKKWLPFIGYDSLRIECKFREARARLSEKSVTHSNAADELVIVRGGLYEVDVIQKTCTPIYWTAKGVVCVLIGTLSVGFTV